MSETTPPNPLDVSARVLARATEHASAYIAGVHGRRVSPDSDAIAALARLDVPLHDAPPSDPTATVDLLHELGSPATVTTTGGRFHGLVVGATLPSSLGARVLASAWDQVVFDESTSPIGVALEHVAGHWILDLLGLPDDASVGFVTGATMANLTCLAAAREHLLSRAGWNVNRQGLGGAPALRFVAGDETHVTAKKALSLLGLGTDAIESVACDDNGALRIDELPSLDERTVVLLQAGNVNSGACDPIGEVVARARRAGAWVHVDGAFGLWAAASPRTRHLLEGLAGASSWAVDGHKWLNTPYDCGIAICKHSRAVHEAMRTRAPYLIVGDDARAIAPKDMAPEFSRSARGVEVWAALHSLGRTGVASLVERCVDRARQLGDGLSALGFEVMNEIVLNQVVATLPGHEGEMAAMAARIRDSGDTWFGATTWRGRAAVRFSISSWATESGDIERTLIAIEREMPRRA